MKVFIFLFLFIPLHATYYSQYEQDKFIHENFFWKHKNKVFVDIGAYDGTTFSNTCYFEKEKGWSGLCIEPIPDAFAKLQASRNCICIQGCVTDWTGLGNFLYVKSSHWGLEMFSGLLEKYHPNHLQKLEGYLSTYGGTYEIYPVNCYLLMDLLKLYHIRHVSLLSIDTEGGELDILRSIDFSKIRIDVITVEDNYGNPLFEIFLKEKGFLFVKRIGQDLIFINKKFKPSSKA